MSRAHPTEWEEYQNEEPCESCNAVVGEWCRTNSGRPAQIPHAARYRLAFDKRRAELAARRKSRER